MPQVQRIERVIVIDHQLSFLSVEGIDLALKRRGYTANQLLSARFTGEVNDAGQHIYEVTFPLYDEMETGVGFGNVFVEWGKDGPEADF